MNEPHIDKTGRKKYGFDEVCLQVNESIKDPATEGRESIQQGISVSVYS